MPTNELLTARALIRSQLGEAVESKASDEFCLAFARPTRFSVDFETVRGAEWIVPPTVVELSLPESFEAVSTGNRGEKRKSHWKEAERAVGRAIESLQEGPSPKPSMVLRDARTRLARESIYKDAAPIHDALERTTGGPLRPGVETIGSPRTPSVITEFCWLNGSLRTWASPMALADVAGDKKIERIDVPRRLESDLTVTPDVVGAPAYRVGSGNAGAGVITAVIDSEIATGHPALAERVIHRANFTREAWGNPGDHGTAVAGIVGSADDAITGMAPEATIYNYKVLATNRFLNGDDFDGALAIQQALEDGVRVANCSWGAGPVALAKSREARACDAAWALGMTIVKSAGNRGDLGASSLTTPADADGVIVVGGTDREGSAVQDYSSRGPTMSGMQRPHLVAPGGSAAAGMISCLVGGGFGDVGSGTSYAAPHVTGLIALLLQEDPSLTPDEVRDVLVGSCTLLGVGDPNDQGAGLIRAGGFPS
jgi:serine protease AprX